MIYRVRPLPCFVLTMAVVLATSCVHRGETSSVNPALKDGSNSVATGAPRIRLFWRTETEDNAYAFFVYRADEPGADEVCINADHPLPAAGNSTTPQEYVFYDLHVEQNRVYYYRLQQVDLDGAQFWIAGHPEMVVGRTKPLTNDEAAEIARHGTSFRRSTFETPHQP
ncbi:MAG: hypothetical protein AMXMBFR84_33720 [Candidatus Hydrogenedentota bacterium]